MSCPVIVVIGGRTVGLSVYAAIRWADRVRQRPMSFGEVTTDLVTLAAWAAFADAHPVWHALVAGEWLLFGPDVALPLKGDVAVTTLVRGGLSEGERVHRN